MNKKAASKRTVSKRTVIETPTTRNELSGFGDNVVKLTDSETAEVLVFIGKQEGEDKVYFPKPISLEQLHTIFDLLSKKKFNKYLFSEQFDKAQEFADRKFV